MRGIPLAARSSANRSMNRANAVESCDAAGASDTYDNTSSVQSASQEFRPAKPPAACFADPGSAKFNAFEAFTTS
jgi:hypothetical protein